MPGLAARGVAGQAAFAGLKTLFRPPVNHRGRDALAPAQFGDAVFAAQTVQRDADLVRGREMAPRGAGLASITCSTGGSAAPHFLFIARSMAMTMNQKPSLSQITRSVARILAGNSFLSWHGLALLAITLKMLASLKREG